MCRHRHHLSDGARLLLELSLLDGTLDRPRPAIPVSSRCVADDSARDLVGWREESDPRRDVVGVGGRWRRRATRAADGELVRCGPRRALPQLRPHVFVSVHQKKDNQSQRLAQRLL